jgi:hypothetical protein
MNIEDQIIFSLCWLLVSSARFLGELDRNFVKEESPSLLFNNLVEARFLSIRIFILRLVVPSNLGRYNEVTRTSKHRGKITG